MINEIWKPIQGFEGIYEISSFGRVRSKERKVPNKGGFSPIKEKILSFGDCKGYYTVILSKWGKHKTYRVNRLVAEAFLPNPNNYPMVNHKNEIKLDNRVDNLEWCDAQYNADYSISKPVEVINTLTQEKFYFKSSTSAGKMLKIDQSNISRACRGEIGLLRGKYQCRYV